MISRNQAIEPVVRVELGVGPVALVRPRELEAGAAAAAVARVVEGVVNVGGGRGRREREAAGTRVGARANHAWISVYLVPELAEGAPNGNKVKRQVLKR